MQVEDLLRDQRREAERGLVEQQQPRPAHQRARDRQHLLLAAGQRAAALAQALLQARQQRRDTRSRSCAKCARSPTTAPICRFSSTVMRGKMRRPSGDCAMRSRAISWVGSWVMSLPVEGDRAVARARVAADRHHQRRLAGAVGADQRDDLAVVHVEVDAAQRRDVAVVGLDAAHGQEERRSQRRVTSRFRLAATSSSRRRRDRRRSLSGRCARAGVPSAILVP